MKGNSNIKINFYKAQIIKIFPSLGQTDQLSEEISCFSKFKEVGKKAKI